MDRLQKKEQQRIQEENKKHVLGLVPVAKGIIKIITEADLHVGDNEDRSKEEFEKFRKTTEDILKYLQKERIKFSDLNFLFSLVLQPFDYIKGIALESLKQSFERGEVQAWGKEYRDIDLQDIDDMIRKGLPEDTSNA